jgi:cytochrome c peroxidase
VLLVAVVAAEARQPGEGGGDAPRPPLPGLLPQGEGEDGFLLAQGLNPYPVRLVRPSAAPLSAMARLGQRIFFDTGLSASGQMACASCHNPAEHYGPPDDAPGERQRVRAIPSLTYLERHAPFSVGPDRDEDENSSVPLQIVVARGATRAPKTAHNTADSAVNLVPQGGLFWDGRVNTLQEQASQPLLNPTEMANASAAEVAAKLRARPYASYFAELFGPAILDEPKLLMSEAMFAVARYQIEEPGFHPYTSKYDYWLEGSARFTPDELRGYLLFNDPDKANCDGCHLDRPAADGTPPVFTDGQFEALGAPRNPALLANRDPAYFDLGVCGPYRDDMRDQTQFCGMFTTPTLRNAATRHAFFHNGTFRSLQQVMDFYAFRDVAPEKVYPRGPDGEVAKYDDIPPRFRANIDVVDPPFDRHPGDPPAMTEQDERDIIAFLRTLTDGYRPDPTVGP